MKIVVSDSNDTAHDSAIFLKEFALKYDPAKIERYYKGKDRHYDKRGPYRLKPLEATKSMDPRPNLIYPIPGPNGEEVLPKRQWLWAKERVLRALQNDELPDRIY